MRLEAGRRPQTRPAQIAVRRRPDAVEVVSAGLGQTAAARIGRIRAQRGVLAVVDGDGLGQKARPQRPGRTDAPKTGDPQALTPHVAAVRQAQRRIIHIAADGFVVADQPDRDPVLEQGQVDHQLPDVTRPAARGQRRLRSRLSVEAREIGRAGHHLDHAAHRPRPVQRALRAPQHLDPFDIGQPKRRIGRVIGQTDIVQIQADQGLGLARHRTVRHAANEQLVPPRPQIGDGQARDPGGDALKVGHAGPVQRQSVQRGQAVGRARQQKMVRSRRRHHHLVEHDRHGGRGRRVGAVRGGPGRRRGQPHDPPGVCADAAGDAVRAQRQPGQGRLDRQTSPNAATGAASLTARGIDGDAGLKSEVEHGGSQRLRRDRHIDDGPILRHGPHRRRHAENDDQGAERGSYQGATSEAGSASF